MFMQSGSRSPASDTISGRGVEQSRDDISLREASNPPAYTNEVPRYESDNMWDYKPAWCQPWSILSTGIGFVSVVYSISGHSKLITAIAGLPILAWWALFLVLVPANFREYVQSQKGSSNPEL